MGRPAILICANERCAPGDTAQRLTTAAHSALAQHHVTADVFTVTCLDLCGRGPHVVLHGAPGDVPLVHRAPDGGVAYDAVDEALMRRLVTEHLVRGHPLTPALHVAGIPRR